MHLAALIELPQTAPRFGNVAGVYQHLPRRIGQFQLDLVEAIEFKPSSQRGSHRLLRHRTHAAAEQEELATPRGNLEHIAFDDTHPARVFQAAILTPIRYEAESRAAFAR